MAIPAATLPTGIGRKVGGGGGGMDCGIVRGQLMILVLAGMMKRRREGRLELHTKAEEVHQCYANDLIRLGLLCASPYKIIHSVFLPSSLLQ